MEWCNEQGTFVDSEGEPIVSLHFRKAYADSEDNSE